MATIKNNATLEKENRELQAQMDALLRKQADLERRVPEESGPPIIAPKFRLEFTEGDKIAFIRDQGSRLKALMLFAPEKTRAHKRAQWNRLVADARIAFEAWVEARTGRSWKLAAMEVLPRHLSQPTDDDYIGFEFIHKGRVAGIMKDPAETLTPTPENITVALRVYKYELD